MSNTYDLHGKSALVTGGAKSIGRAVAELLVASGASVTVWDLTPANVPGTSSAVVDVTDSTAIAEALSMLPEAGDPAVLVNCAGYLGRTQPFIGHRAEDWERIVSVNLLGTMRVTQAVLPRMVQAGRGRIVNFGSLAGKEIGRASCRERV